MSDARLERIERSLDTLVTGQFALQVDVKELRTGQEQLRTEVKDSAPVKTSYVPVRNRCAPTSMTSGGPSRS